MCVISKLDCQSCHRKGLYVWQFCAAIQDNPSFGKRLEPGDRIHCPNLNWPPMPEDNHTCEHICENCLRQAVEYRQLSATILRANKSMVEIFDTMCKPPADSKEIKLGQSLTSSSDGPSSSSSSSEESPASSVVIMRPAYKDKDYTGGSEEQTSSPSSSEVSQRLFAQSTIKGYLPIHIMGDVAQWMTKKHCIKDAKKSDEYWSVRSAMAPHRELTIYIPMCNICKNPKFNKHGGIRGAYFEPNSVLWQAAYEIKHEELAQTKLSTAFMIRPCDRCFKREETLREKVNAFISNEDCSRLEAWAVWQWLSTRHNEHIQFFEHECMGLGFPDTKPYPVHEYLSLMADGFTKRAGVRWDSFVDLDRPSHRTFPTLGHWQPLTSMTQWNSLVVRGGHIDPNVRPLPSDDEDDDADSETSESEIQETEDSDAEELAFWRTPERNSKGFPTTASMSLKGRWPVGGSSSAPISKTTRTTRSTAASAKRGGLRRKADDDDYESETGDGKDKGKGRAHKRVRFDGSMNTTRIRTPSSSGASPGSKLEKGKQKQKQPLAGTAAAKSSRNRVEEFLRGDFSALEADAAADAGTDADEHTEAITQCDMKHWHVVINEKTHTLNGFWKLPLDA
ncbi:hypothetical protein F4778DRAFT_652880 [Xylariomycetidae sp. FL2044]|nr:hypothetical protein F4778DRAFT_652880 [Xylariomycetidae sp. FL2044]